MHPKEIVINSSWMSFYNIHLEPKESQKSTSKNSCDRKIKS